MDGRRIRQLLLAIGAVVLLRVALFAVLDAVAPYEGSEVASGAVELVHGGDAGLSPGEEAPLFPAPTPLHGMTEVAASGLTREWISVDDAALRDPTAVRRSAASDRTIAHFRD